MNLANVPFKHCSTEAELEAYLTTSENDSKVIINNERRVGKITFNLPNPDDNRNSEPPAKLHEAAELHKRTTSGQPSISN